ncbi:MAG TPA: cytochrome P450 [Actinomycetota bacterium]|nr:cytochrome P450 [Actinomycetota bacterium]
MTPVFYNPLDPEVHADPYPHYRRLREEDPVHLSLMGYWVLSRYEDVAALVRDPRLGHELHGAMDGASMLFRDPPAHTRLRSLVSRAFTPRMLERLKPRIRDIVDRSLSRARETGELDVIADLAFPLPATVISEMLGLPIEDHRKVRRWGAALARTLDPVMDPDDMTAIGTASMEFSSYLSEQVARRKAEPRDDLLTALLAAEQEGDRLTSMELLTTVELLFVAGHETTTNLIGNGFLALLRNQDQLRRLRDEPALLRSGIEELLRYDSPVQFLIRTVKDPVTVGGRNLARGDSALLLVGAANRDPAAFPEPDVLDVGRPDVRHLSFGGGIHFCLGSALARMEGQIAIGALVSLFEEFKFGADSLQWREHINLRGLESLPVRAA